MNLRFPEHECELSLVHNQCRSWYETVKEWVGEEERKPENDRYLDWVSEEQKIKAIESNEVWVLHWYPHTPVGFNVLAACDLDVLLQAAAEQ